MSAKFVIELALFYKLLKCTEAWQWTSRQKKAIERFKELLVLLQLLVQFDPSLEIHQPIYQVGSETTPTTIFQMLS